MFPIDSDREEQETDCSDEMPQVKNLEEGNSTSGLVGLFVRFFVCLGFVLFFEGFFWCLLLVLILERDILKPHPDILILIWMQAPVLSFLHWIQLITEMFKYEKGRFSPGKHGI